ncbi:MAG: hypothetical protein ACRDTF_03085 [Pseudonocardiaceae bacterium]
MIDAAPAYEPRYYERSAQRHMARYLQSNLFINVPWGLSGSPASRSEIDAVAILDRRATPIEIKAYFLDIPGIEEIIAKYTALGFRRLIIVAPSVSDKAARRLANETIATELVLFQPQTSEISDWYDRAWPGNVPHWVRVALSSGRHHIRFVMSRPTRRGGYVVGQQRSRVYGVETLSRLLRALPSPPVRVLWTPLRFTIPRDVIARKSRLTQLGGFVPVDIDGDRLHRALHACKLAPENDVCQFCLGHTRQEQTKLCDQLAVRPVDVVSSGGRGVHIYYHDDGFIRAELLGLAERRLIRIDENVTASTKATVALPGSLHAGSMRPITSLFSQLESNEGTLCS